MVNKGLRDLIEYIQTSNNFCTLSNSHAYYKQNRLTKGFSIDFSGKWKIIVVNT